MGAQRYRTEFKRLLENTVLPEGISLEEQNNRLLPLTKYLVEHVPSRLFRYRTCSEMNLDAFNEDKLFAVTSDKFNDPYDCLIRYDKEMLKQSIIAGMSKDVILSLRGLLRTGSDFPEMWKTLYDQEFLNQVKTTIVNADDNTIEKYGEIMVGMKHSLDERIDKITEEVVKTVKQLTFIACFGEDIHSVTMWSHYADSHRGFALEYAPKSLQLNCQLCNQMKQCNKAAVCNLYPVIYQQRRCDATDFLGLNIGQCMGLPIKNPDTFATTKFLLFKSVQWNYEKEWRLIISKFNEPQNKAPFCLDNIRPAAIYYGSRISPINKKMLHLIAQEKGIKEYQMFIDDKSYNYSVKYVRERTKASPPRDPLFCK